MFRDAISALVGKAGQPLIRFDIFNWTHWKLCLMTGSNGSCLCVYMCTLQSVIHETQQNKIQKLSLRRVFGRQFAIAYRGDIDKILTSHYKRSVSCLSFSTELKSHREPGMFKSSAFKYKLAYPSLGVETWPALATAPFITKGFC